MQLHKAYCQQLLCLTSEPEMQLTSKPCARELAAAKMHRSMTTSVKLQSGYVKHSTVVRPVICHYWQTCSERLGMHKQKLT